MNENLKLLMDNPSLPRKLKLLFFISLNRIETSDKNISAKGLPFELEEIKEIQKLNHPDFLTFLYINKDKVHEKLYEKEELLEINFEIKDKKISQYIYLCFLIEDGEMCDYQYFFELISRLHDIQRGEQEKILKKIIMAKMIISLIYNYNQIEDNEDNKNNKHEKELKTISDFNSSILDNKENITKLNQYGFKLEDIKSKKIEEIYLIIIKYLIENSKLEDSDYIESIINQIELESIIFTKLMLDELTKILIIEKEYIKKYKINNFDDIFDKKKIYFYYNLIKYILKQSTYIYQIPFLLETRTKILNLIKNNLGKLSTFIKKNDYQIEYILKQIIGDNSYKYYYEESESIIKNNQSHNSSQKSNKYGPNSSYLNRQSVVEAHENMENGFENNAYYSSSSGPFSQNSYKSAKQKSNRSFDNDFDNDNDNEGYNENELEYKILNNSIFILHTHEKGKTPFIIYDEIKIIKKIEKENGEIIETENKTIDEIKNATTNNEKLLNNYKKFLSFIDKFESILTKEFINNYKLKVTLTFETQNININKDFIISCIYDLEIPGENSEQYRDDNILTNGSGEGFQYMLSEINNGSYSDKKYS